MPGFGELRQQEIKQLPVPMEDFSVLEQHQQGLAVLLAPDLVRRRFRGGRESRGRAGSRRFRRRRPCRAGLQDLGMCHAVARSRDIGPRFCELPEQQIKQLAVLLENLGVLEQQLKGSAIVLSGDLGQVRFPGGRD